MSVLRLSWGLTQTRGLGVTVAHAACGTHRVYHERDAAPRLSCACGQLVATRTPAGRYEVTSRPALTP